MRADEARRLADGFGKARRESLVIEPLIGSIEQCARFGGRHAVVEVNPDDWYIARAWLDRNSYTWNRCGTGQNKFIQLKVEW